MKTVAAKAGNDRKLQVLVTSEVLALHSSPILLDVTNKGLIYSRYASSSALTGINRLKRISNYF